MAAVVPAGTTRMAQAQELTRRLHDCAKNKSLTEARRIFARFESGELPSSVYSYSAMLHVLVQTGNVDEAGALLRKCAQPNIVCYTTVLKGLSQTADVESARELVSRMMSCWPPVMDVRAVNTFLRCCENGGDVNRAMEMYDDIQAGVLGGVRGDATTHSLISSLMKSGLMAKALSEVVTVVQELSDGGCGGSGDPSAGRCIFWEKGECQRGTNCRYFHDPALRTMQRNAASDRLSWLDVLAAVHVNAAHCFAVLGKLKRARSHLRSAESAMAELAEAMAAANHGNGCQRDNRDLFRETNREERRREIERIREFCTRVKRNRKGRAAGDSTSKSKHLQRRCLLSCLSRTFVFPLHEKTHAGTEGATTADDCVAALARGFGLSELTRRGWMEQSRMAAKMRRCFDSQEKLQWRTIFRKSADPAAPVKMEICSGNGDWVVEQASADSENHWVALELKYDRVYEIFSRMFMRSTAGGDGKGARMCVLGGDASFIVPRRIEMASISHCFINFPEPPHWSGDETAESRQHLLTGPFFDSVMSALEAEGRLTILSDNHKYMRVLAETLSRCSGPKKETFMNVQAVKSDSFEEIAASEVGTDGGFTAIRLHRGIPGPDAGHLVYTPSFFDRFWHKGQHSDRFFIVVQKQKKVKKQKSRTNSYAETDTAAEADTSLLMTKAKKRRKKNDQ